MQYLIFKQGRIADKEILGQIDKEQYSTHL